MSEDAGVLFDIKQESLDWILGIPRIRERIFRSTWHAFPESTLLKNSEATP